jgi:hypothetical protein
VYVAFSFCHKLATHIAIVISVGRDSEAREILKKWHAGGEENNGLVHFEYHEIKSAIALEAQRGTLSPSSHPRLIATDPTLE